MTGFLDRMGARARGDAIAPALHLRPRTRFEPDPVDEVGDPVTVPGANWSGSEPSPSGRSRQADPFPAAADRPVALAGHRSSVATPTVSPAIAARIDPDSSAYQETARGTDSRAADSARAAPPNVPRSSGGLPSVDPVQVVRQHVVPRLVSDGVLPEGADPEVVVTSRQRATMDHQGARGIRLNVDPGPGARDQGPAASVGGVLATSSAPGLSRPPDVHVHIGRIEVVHPVSRQPPPAPPRATPRRATSADHATYLARRRETS